MSSAPQFRKLLPLLPAALALLALVFASGASGLPYDQLPDPMQRGSYTVKRTDPLKLGLTTFQEPNSKGGAATGSNSTITVQIRGVIFQPESYAGKSPLLLFVHGNHGECDSGSAPACTIYKRNDEGYAYLGENLASWGYTVVSLDQDELMSRQDSLGKGMHNRRLLIMAMLDKLKEASEGPVVEDANSNVGSLLAGHLDMTRIGLMGHSRGGDAVSSFVEYDHTRPVGERYPLRAVISLAPVDYERHVPYGVPFLALVGTCDGDVSNLQGARLYERSQYTGDPYPKYQILQVGGNHNAYNSVWQTDADDASATDVACGPDVTGQANNKGKLTTNTHSIRLSGEAGPHFAALEGEVRPYHIENTNKLDPTQNTRISGDPALMGDQEKLGLATMSAFFRRYVGGEGAMEPYLTGETAAEGKPSIPMSACPSSEAGQRIPCIDRVADSYTAPPSERLDVIRPDTEDPTTVSALGTKILATGFANPYVKKGGGVTPKPATTPTGIDWCNPDPKQQEPAQLKEGENPTSAKPCPAPGLEALGGQAAGTRERAPANGSYGRQLAVAWEEPVETSGSPAKLSTMIPGADKDVSGYKALYLAAAVNFFDSRNPARGEEGLWNPEAAPQNFTIAVTDAEGHEASVNAGDPRYGTALQQTLGSTSARVHVILRDIRVPLSDLSAQGVDLTKVRKVELRFGELGMPQSGSIQLADLRFQQAVGGSHLLLDSTAPNAGPGEGPPTSGPDPVAEMASGTYRRADADFEMADATKTPGGSVWTVDDDGVQCPNAQFEHIQEAVEYASPWDTIVVCAGVYPESSTPVNSELSPLQIGAMNGLTINKPLKIVGAGASKVTIKPASALGTTLAGTEPYLRDGGGNVITVSRQSLGSTEYDEEYVDISGVTIESPSAYVEAGVAFFNSSGRIANSVVGPLKRVSTAGELTSKPHGWGIVATDSQVGAGSGTAERQVAVVNSKVFGYQSGGIRFDDARGTDAAATTTEPSGMKEVGLVKNTLVEGQSSTVFPQTGIQYHAGATGAVTGSRITNNRFTSEPRKSVGVLLTGAGTAFSISGSAISGNGYGIYNADSKNEVVREGAPAQASGNFWGANGTPIAEATKVGPPVEEGISPADAGANPSVAFEPVLGAAPAAPVVGTQSDAAPVGAIVNPGGGEAVEAGVSIEPVVLAEDDYGVKSVSLKADGSPLGSRGEAPYTFVWSPSAADIGTTVQLTATITDSNGQTSTSTVSVSVTKSSTEAQGEKEKEQAEEEQKEAEEEAEEAAEKAQEEKEAAEAALKDAEAKAAAAVKAAEEKSAVEAKQAQDEALKAQADAAAAAKAAAEAEARAKAAEEKAELATKHATEAREKSETPEATKVTRSKAKGTATLSVAVPGAGQVTIGGEGVAPATVTAGGAGTVAVPVKASGKAAKALAKKGQVKVNVKITFTFPDGVTASGWATVSLKKTS